MTVHSDFVPDRSAGAPAAAIEALLPAPRRRRRRQLRKSSICASCCSTGAAIAVLAGAAWYGWDYWTVGQYLVSTDDAYVKADSTTIAPKVTGYLQSGAGEGQ